MADDVNIVITEVAADEVQIVLTMVGPIAGNYYENQYFVYTDGTTAIRRGVRDGYDVYDVILTPTGFDGIEGVDWENRDAELI